MRQTTRQEIFGQAAKKLRQNFEELSATVTHSGLKGGEAEDLVRKFLQGHLPKRFDVGSGLIIDPQDNLSKQTDVIIYDALNCPVYRASERAAIIPSDNVAAIVEVKSLLDKEKLRDAFDNARTVKGLSKTTPVEVPGLLITAQTMCFLFAFKTMLTLEKLTEHYRSHVCEYGLGRHIDVVLVLDKGLIMLAAKVSSKMNMLPGMEGWAPLMLEGFGAQHAEGSHIGVAMMEIKEDGLDLFLRFLLAHLMHFRAQVVHPGFWLKEQPQMLVTYLTSVTHETDPTRRAEILRRYEDEVRLSSAPNNAGQAEPQGFRESRSASEAPDVIHLPPPRNA